MSAPPPTVLPCKRCWIEIELRDDHDAAVGHQPYWIKLPDGQIREGRLDERGLARLDGIPCGLCLVRFPGLTAPAVRLQAASGARRHFLEIELLGADDIGVADEPYRVTLPDGSTRSGTLDRKGMARVDDLPEGLCRVTFPGLDRSEYMKASGSND